MQALLPPTTWSPRAGEYRLRVDRCLVELSVKHMMMRTVRGRFAATRGTLFVDEDPMQSWVRVDLDAASFSTGLPERDEAICGPDFLDVRRYPVIRFESTLLDGSRPGRLAVSGDLYVKNTVGPLEIDARLVSHRGDRLGFDGTAVLRRSDLGMTWGAAIERAGMVVSDTVKLSLAAEFRP